MDASSLDYVCLMKLIVAQVVKKFPFFCRTLGSLQESSTDPELAVSYVQPEHLRLPIYTQVSEMFTSRHVFLL